MNEQISLILDNAKESLDAARYWQSKAAWIFQHIRHLWYDTLKTRSEYDGKG
jgi:hypothetical protein